MARSGAARQKAYLHRQRDELLSMRQRVHELEVELAAARARIDAFERADSAAPRLPNAATDANRGARRQASRS
jgi:hypothetical protein